ncbi:MAG: phosphatidate cytidylyltransferase [Planctomycetaceae bacterium]
MLIPALIGLFVIDHRSGDAAPLLFLLCLALAIRAAWELRGLLAVRNMRPQLVESVAGCVALLLAAWWPHLKGGDTVASETSLGLIGLTMSLCVIGLLGMAAARYRRAGESMEMFGANLVIVAYCGLLLATTAQLRWLAGPQAGYLLLGSLIVTAKLGDVSAYTVGRLFGKRKMSPLLSPGKTWAGFFGALGGAALASWLWLTFVTPLFGDGWRAPPAWASLLYGLVIGLVALFGDLCESLIKRDVGQKDSAPLLPGFGGLLDLLDSVLYAGPAAVLLWKLLPLATW